MSVQSRTATHVPKTREFIQVSVILNQRKQMNTQNWVSRSGPVLQELSAGPGRTKDVWHPTESGSCSPKYNGFPRHSATQRLSLALTWLPRALTSTAAQCPVLLFPKKQLLMAWADIPWLGNLVSYFKGNLEITTRSAWHLKEIYTSRWHI